jgi:hypothetical protein
MKQNWSKFFTQYIMLLVFGSLLIFWALIYIDDLYKSTLKSDDLQGSKTIIIKKTYKSTGIVNEYNDKDYNFEEQKIISSGESTSDNIDNGKMISSSETTSDNIETVDKTYTTGKPKNNQPVKSLKVNRPSPAAKNIDTKTKKGLNAKNPYAIEYANAIKDYIALSKKAEQLKEDKKRATGGRRNLIDDQLRKMKPEEVNLTHRLKSAQKKYRQWEKNH